jgi:putative endonuclease
MHNILLGKLGEEAAANYLMSHGYRIITRNFKARYAELDIIAIDSNTVVFVEVKTRTGNSFGLPQEAITPKKLYSLKRSLEYYMLLHPELPQSLRIDVVAVKVTGDEQVEKIELFKNITSF